MTSNETSTTKVAQQLSQGDAVVQAVRDVLKSEYREGTKVVLSDDHRKAVSELLVKGFAESRIALKPTPTNEAKLKDPKLLQAYVKGLINNWLQKSPLLNGKPAKAKKAADPSAPATPSASMATAAAPKLADVQVARPEAKVQEAVKPATESVAAAIGSKKPSLPAGKK
jgi:hypothetical protein